MKKTRIILIIAAFVFQGCMSTKFSASWKSPDFDGKAYDQVLVWGLSDNVANRSTVEDEVTHFLNLKGVNTHSGADILPYDRTIIPEDQKIIKKKLVDKGYDAVLTIGLKDIKEETHYVQGTGYYNPMSYGYYGSFYGYSSYMYGNVYQPGYYSSTEYIYLETNLWDVETGKLVWSGQSKSTSQGTVDKTANAYARAVVSELINKGILQPTKK
ncbi:MAG: hypothetical protein L3J06_06370 [Cyclobacteriaceae bacterium]|nr:hypothetical protein [Cyclobacteriaceae bacterium]